MTSPAKLLDSVDMLYLAYNDQPEHYVDRMRRAMTAHLEKQRRLPVNRVVDPTYLPSPSPPQIAAPAVPPATIEATTDES